MDAFEKYPDLMREDFIDQYNFDVCWTVENPDKAMSELDVCVALLRTNANFSKAARLLQRSRRTVETFVTRDIMLSDLAEDIGETFLDAVEDSYRLIALKGDGNAAKFFLSTKGKARGFTIRSEMTGTNGGPIEHEVSPRAILLDKLARIRASGRAEGDADGNDGGPVPSTPV